MKFSFLKGNRNLTEVISTQEILQEIFFKTRTYDFMNALATIWFQISYKAFRWVITFQKYP